MFSALKELTIPEGKVVKITSGSVVLWEKPSDSLLPSAYQQVEYIATDGNQAIDTGLKASDYPDGLEYVFSGNCTGLSTKTNNYLFGCLASSKRSCNPSWLKAGTSISIMIGGNGNTIFSKAVSLNTDFTLRAKGSSNAIGDFTATYNDEAFTLKTTSYSNCTMPSANIYVLACNVNGSPSSSTSAPFTGKLYSFTMADMNGNKLREYVPCYRKSDGVIGFYDTVTETFFTNIGTGSFTKGADV